METDEEQGNFRKNFFIICSSSETDKNFDLRLRLIEMFEYGPGVFFKFERDLELELVEQNGKPLLHALEALLDDHEIVLEAFKQGPGC